MKIIIILLLTFLSYPCWGEWVLISKNSQGDSTYVDNNSISIKGPYLYYWELLDYKKINEEYGKYKHLNYNSIDYAYSYLLNYCEKNPKNKIVEGILQYIVELPYIEN